MAASKYVYAPASADASMFKTTVHSYENDPKNCHQIINAKTGYVYNRLRHCCNGLDCRDLVPGGYQKNRYVPQYDDDGNPIWVDRDNNVVYLSNALYDEKNDYYYVEYQLENGNWVRNKLRQKMKKTSAWIAGDTCTGVHLSCRRLSKQGRFQKCGRKSECYKCYGYCLKCKTIGNVASCKKCKRFTSQANPKPHHMSLAFTLKKAFAIVDTAATATATAIVSDVATAASTLGVPKPMSALQYSAPAPALKNELF